MTTEANRPPSAPNPSGTTPITLSRLAGVLGELQPPDDATDMTEEHLERQRALFAAAAYLPINGGADAALAISGVAELIAGILGHDVEEVERDRDLRCATMILARVAAWVTTVHGAKPLSTMWPQWASPAASPPSGAIG